MPSPPLPPARRPTRLTRLRQELEALDARLTRDRMADTEASIASRQSSGSLHRQTHHRDRPPVQSEPPPESLAKHTARAKMIATYVSTVGVAVLGLIFNYYQQRSAQLQQSTSVTRPGPKVVLGNPQINPSHEAVPDASPSQQIPYPAAPPADKNRPVGP